MKKLYVNDARVKIFITDFYSSMTEIPFLKAKCVASIYSFISTEYLQHGEKRAAELFRGNSSSLYPSNPGLK